MILKFKSWLMPVFNIQPLNLRFAVTWIFFHLYSWIWQKPSQNYQFLFRVYCSCSCTKFLLGSVFFLVYSHLDNCSCDLLLFFCTHFKIKWEHNVIFSILYTCNNDTSVFSVFKFYIFIHLLCINLCWGKGLFLFII